MPVRSILVHVNDHPSNSTAIDASLALAERHAAAVTGLYVRPYPVVIPVAPIGGAMPVMDGMIEAYQKASKKAEERFLGKASHAGVSQGWHDDDGDVAERIGFHARYADLAIVGQVETDESDWQTPEDLPATAAIGSGRPVLAIPHTGAPTMTFSRVMLCWNATREASRALHDSLALLEPGARIDVVCIDAEDRQGRDPGADIAAHLSRHGFQADAHHLVSAELSTSETILSASADMASELIIMGAYGHARVREMALGGVTRSMMRHMPVPVLLSH